jgi:predicted lipoprotein with Yx(FWY)xxD motif
MRKLPLLLALGALALGAGAALAGTSVATVGSSTSRLGTLLVGTNGHTLYVFSADKKNKSNCTGGCTHNWPPLLTGAKPKTKGSAVKSGKLGTIKRGSSEQVTYNGHPLYYYVADTVAGDTSGQDTKLDGGVWTVIGPNGSPITSSGKSKTKSGY